LINDLREMRVQTMESGNHLTAAAIAALAMIAGCTRPGESHDSRNADAPQRLAPRVSIVRPDRATIRRTTEQPGQIEAIEVTPIQAKLSGYVRNVAVDIGDRVKKGQVLVELDVPEVEADLKQKRAMVEQAVAEKGQADAALEVERSGLVSAEAKMVEIRAGVRRSTADLARWKAEYARIEQLVRERAQTGSLLDETRNKLESAKAADEEVGAQVKSAEAALAEARARVDKALADVQAAKAHVEVARFEAAHAEAMAGYAFLRSPYDGVVTRRGIDTGQLTTAGTGGDPLYMVARTDIVTISVGVPETDAPFVNAGDPAHIRLLALEGRVFEGTVTRTSWALDPGTRTLLTEIDIPNPDGVLRPGLYAYASIVDEEHKDALTLPATAVFKDGGTSYCVAVADGRARRKAIRTGIVEAKRVEVISGIQESDLIVEANASSLTDGQAVEAVKPLAASPKPKS
jgi:RND family efflux transporter MFP subunit